MHMTSAHVYTRKQSNFLSKDQVQYGVAVLQSILDAHVVQMPFLIGSRLSGVCCTALSIDICCLTRGRRAAM